MDNLNVMSIVFGLLAVLFAAGVAHSLVQIVRHPGPEASPPILARPAPPPYPQRPAEHSGALLASGLFVFALLLLNGLLSRRLHRSPRAR